MKPSLNNLVAVLVSLAWVATSHSSPALVIGSFDYSRSGHISFSSGDYFQQARTSLVAHFTQVTFTSFPTLTSSNLACVNLLVIAAGTTISTPGAPLSTSEQLAVLDYVQRGGAALILHDNYSFSPTAPAEQEALIAPFGMHGYGTVGGAGTAVVVAPQAHPVTSGRFGSVSSFCQVYAGALTNLGPFGYALAANTLGIALAVIEGGAIAPASGRVVIFSDGNSFADPGVGCFSANEALFLNAVDWSTRPTLRIQRGQPHVTLLWRTTTPDCILEASLSLGETASWQPVTNAVTVTDCQSVVAEVPAGGARFYRLRCQ